MKTAFYAVALATGAFGAFAASGCSGGTGWDYLMNVQFWSPTQCTIYGCSGAPPAFSIHGLWPNNNNGTWPCFCEGEEYSLAVLEEDPGLEDVMLQLWPDYNNYSVRTPENYGDFWAHEWNKHGICASLSKEYGPRFGTQNKFFQDVVTLHDNLNATHFMLDFMGVVPAPPPATTNVTTIIDSMAKYYGKRGGVTCNGPQYNYFSCIFLCFDGDLNLVDCPNADEAAALASTRINEARSSAYRGGVVAGVAPSPFPQIPDGPCKTELVYFP